MPWTKGVGGSSNPDAVSPQSANINGLTAGSMVVCAVLCYFNGAQGAIGSIVINDGTSNYTLTPQTPYDGSSTSNNVIWIGYKFVSPGGNLTVTATITGAASTLHIWAIMLDEFKYAGGTPTFDTSVSFSTASGPSQPINQPSITPANLGSLLFETCLQSDNVVGVGGAWTPGQNSGGGDIDGYILSSASGATPVNFTDASTPDSFLAIAAAWFLSSLSNPSPISTPALTADYHWLGGDE